ncbi:MAG: hypothetical protein HN707_03725 [Verrucomicrobia bacterium]|nr:hypothetical protein [Verrucomicrobiota bacterium]MBT4227351.1 hypothetical protein [Verrucomicrobiota bacterium]MBT6788222.1 hypothetical protein [Verrucomicrobiota bacterium]MBT7733995.1 hypothetical protein [Verrucomicrobiota bacterium]
MKKVSESCLGEKLNVSGCFRCSGRFRLTHPRRASTIRKPSQALGP